MKMRSWLIGQVLGKVSHWPTLWKGVVFFVFLKWAIPGLFFVYFCLFITVDSKQMFNKFCRWLDSNCGHLVSEATALPTEPHNHCPQPLRQTKGLFVGLIVPMSQCYKQIWSQCSYATLKYTTLMISFTNYVLYFIP